MQSNRLEKLSLINKEIEEKSRKLSEDYSNLNSPENQLKGLSIEINSYINEVLNSIKDNENTVENNQVLINSLIQISQFVGNKASIVRIGKATLISKLEVYKECSDSILNLISEESSYESNLEKEKIIEDRIKEKIDTGELNRPRKIGARPEKLRDVRQTIAKIDQTEISQEDI